MNNPLLDELEKKKLLRKRYRDLGLKVGVMDCGVKNSLLDVPGVRVGQCTLFEREGERDPGQGPIRTGVTVITPNDNVFQEKVTAGSFVLNGAGEMSGVLQVNEWGLIETPIALCNTMSVGTVSESICSWMTERYSDIQKGRQVVIPVVGECDDSFLNDSGGMHLKKSHIISAINHLNSDHIEEGVVGAGTGMICCDFKAGIGSSSRIIEIDGENFVLGALVLANFGKIEELRIDGFPLGRSLEKNYADQLKRRDNYGSVIVILGTNVPLNSLQLTRLCKRSSLGVGRVGSIAAHGSGEIMLAFSTSNQMNSRDCFHDLRCLNDFHIDPIYRAAIEATEEAILNSLCMAVEVEGVLGNIAPALPLDKVIENLRV